MTSAFRVTVVWLFSLVLLGCSEKSPLVMISDDNYPEKLSDWGIHTIRSQTLQLNEGVIPYDLNTPLFTDYASKLRTLWMPEGKQASVVDGEIVYPLGTILTKTFYYPVSGDLSDEVKPAEGGSSLFHSVDGLPLSDVRLIETRVLLHQESGWTALPYVWNPEQTEATLEWAGDSARLKLITEGKPKQPFIYVVPDANQCAGCHAEDDNRRTVKPLGPKIRHLNRSYAYESGTENQLTYWTRTGRLSGIDDPENEPRNALWPEARANESLGHKARSYLDANCSHCHNPEGAARTSGLFLTMETPHGVSLGFCKRPVAAGKGAGNRSVAIFPGDAAKSILSYRMESTDPGEMMPESGRALPHKNGINLIRQWINSLHKNSIFCKTYSASTQNK